MFCLLQGDISSDPVILCKLSIAPKYYAPIILWQIRAYNTSIHIQYNNT